MNSSARLTARKATFAVAGVVSTLLIASCDGSSGPDRPRATATFLRFDGQNDFVEVPDDDAFSITTTGALTVALEMNPAKLKFDKTEVSGYVYVMGKGEPNQHEWALRMYSSDNTEDRQNRISIYVFSPAPTPDNPEHHGNGSYFQQTVTPGEWIQVVAIMTLDHTYLYKNGLSPSSSKGGSTDCDRHTDAVTPGDPCDPPFITVAPRNGNAPLRIGTRNENSFFEGGIRNVRFWNRKLTNDEIDRLYRLRQSPRNGLVAEYLLNEGAGSIAHDSAGGHNGTIKGGAAWATS